MIQPLLGRPRIGSERTVTHRVVSRQGFWDFLANGVVVDGTKTRDPGNSADSTLVIRPGTLMGKVTSGGKYANSVIGVTTGAYTSGGTTLTVSAAQAAELARRVGASGTFKLVGPATAGGSNNTTTVTYSAVNTSNGQITITDIGANRIAGCLVCPSDGSETPLTLVPDGYGLVIPDDSADVEWPLVPIGGVIDQAQILPAWPSDATLRTYIRTSLSSVSGGKFTFGDQF